MSELTNIENGKVKLSLKIPAEDYRRALESAYRRTGAHYNIPGFRKGKVPRKVIEATYGVNVFWMRNSIHSFKAFIPMRLPNTISCPRFSRTLSSPKYPSRTASASPRKLFSTRRSNSANTME